MQKKQENHLKDNKYVAEIFDKYAVDTYHQEVGLPAFT